MVVYFTAGFFIAFLMLAGVYTTAQGREVHFEPAALMMIVILWPVVLMLLLMMALET